MNKLYTVLKKFGDYKKGETFDPTKDGYTGTEEDIATAVEKGFLAELGDGEKTTDKDTDAKPKAKKVKATSVTVNHAGGERVFSQEIHGDNFAELADEFAETNNGTIA